MPAFKRFLLVTSALLSTGAAAGTVTVLTSLPKELVEVYRQEFEQGHPGIRLEFLNKNHAAAITYVRDAPPGARPDVFWASAPDAFEVLARSRLLAPVGALRDPPVPAAVGGYPVDDPGGHYLGQALSGYGIVWNRRYLDAHRIAPPRQWEDLADAAYHGHVVMSSPSRSGTTHLLLEAILQGEGWARGWNTILRIAGNCAAITDRSFGTPDGVNTGQYGAGLVIDFFGLSAKANGYPVEFSYPTPTAVVPASIGLVEGARNPGDARAFIRFTLSREGQQLLFLPRISRVPVLPLDTPGLRAPARYPDLYEVAAKAQRTFSSSRSESRYPLVNALFDQTVTFRLDELRAAAAAVHEAERALRHHPDERASALLAQARALAFGPVLSEGDADAAGIADLFRKDRRDADVARHLGALEAAWNSAALANYARARSLAKEAARLARS